RSTEGLASAIRSRSPGWIRACSCSRFHRRTSLTDTPYFLAINDTVSCGRTTWKSWLGGAATRLDRDAACTGSAREWRLGVTAATTAGRLPAGTLRAPVPPGGGHARTNTGVSV